VYGLYRDHRLILEGFMFETIKQLLILVTKSNKIWLIPIVLTLIIIALLVISAQISPVPIFLYPII